MLLQLIIKITFFHAIDLNEGIFNFRQIQTETPKKLGPKSLVKIESVTAEILGEGCYCCYCCYLGK